MDYALPIVYFGAKYVLAAALMWLGIHMWVTGQFGRTSNLYDGRTWLARHPTAYIALVASVWGLLLFVLSNLGAMSEMVYLDLLDAGAPYLYNWSAISAVGILGAVSTYLYSIRQARYGGGLSFAAVMLAAAIVPYYAYPLLA